MGCGPAIHVKLPPPEGSRGLYRAALLPRDTKLVYLTSAQLLPARPPSERQDCTGAKTGGDGREQQPIPVFPRVPLPRQQVGAGPRCHGSGPATLVARGREVARCPLTPDVFGGGPGGLGLNEIRLIHRGPERGGAGAARPVGRRLNYARNMDRLLRLGGGMPGLGQGPPTDAPAVDTAEQVYISSLALLKMLKHGRAGVPMEVMGLMLGEFVDDYTVRVIDVFAMPQSGTGVSVEAVDPVFQAKMLDMLKQTGRPEMVVGWYHSHPGFGCWLSGVDINTQQSFEALSERAVAVVVDPIQSVKGKVVIDAFRLINANMMVLGHEPRQTTSNLGHLNKPSIQALIHGLNRHYYSITINYRKNELEQKMLLNLHKKSWMEGLTLQDYSEHCKLNETVVKEMLELAKNYNKAVEEEDKMTPEQLAIKNVGKQDPKRHLEEHVDVLMTSNIVQCLAAMLDTVVFK
ncbi:26S proteasome non-ATPase regulatory subunit 14 [Alligator mississippiensis]|uniref:26S proteasome non-ATPase regulatory subunit 14 n=1 Tax=Alligator mississippiensis TaxID=8496 RepID=A0A151M0E7_ALLMI|nr:26S proteasome non-ATPase regulatory subunit 14 [Alligator mississippiensis]